MKDLSRGHFPIAVFGTLRCIPKDQGNSSLMFVKKPLSHKKCFIPHFLPNGMWLDFKKDACGIAEIFFYEAHDWPYVLSKIDHLEGFSKGKNKYGYRRTLMNVRMTPDDFADDLYAKGISMKDRDLSIPRKEWHFPSVAAWVYSNSLANDVCNASLSSEENPINFC